MRGTRNGRPMDLVRVGPAEGGARRREEEPRPPAGGTASGMSNAGGGRAPVRAGDPDALRGRLDGGGGGGATPAHHADRVRGPRGQRVPHGRTRGEGDPDD